MIIYQDYIIILYGGTITLSITIAKGTRNNNKNFE
jgi:hypothetical protein